MRISSRERVLNTINLCKPDYVPIFITITPQLAEKLSIYLNIEEYSHADSPLSENRISFSELLLPLGNDMVGIGACAPIDNPTQELEPGFFVDEWGIKYRKAGYYSEMIEYPLAEAKTIFDVEAFQFPDPRAKGRYALSEKMVKQYGKEYAVIGDVECTIFEGSWHLTGLEKFIVDLAEEKEYTFLLMDRMMDYSIGVGKELIKRGADIIWLGDDMGTQRGMLIAPEMWKKYFRNRLEKVIKEFREANSMVKIAYHCCGSFLPIIPDLIEIGVDILNALQPQAKDMELDRLKKRFGHRATLFGGIDIQRILPFGTLKEIEQEVKRVIYSAGRGGGYILAGAHNIQPDTSVKKLEAVFRFARQYGKYS